MTDAAHRVLQGNIKSVAKTSSLVVITLLFGKVLAYAYRVIIGRHYGPETYGVFVLALSIVGWFVIFATLGLTQGLIRYLAYYRGKDELHKIQELIRKVFTILLVSGVFFGSILFGTSTYIAIHFFHNANLALFLKFFSIAVPLTVLMNANLSILQAFEKISAYSFIFNFLLNFLKVFILGILIRVGLNSTAIVFSHIASIAISLIATYYLSRKYIPLLFTPNTKNKEKEPSILKDIFAYSIPLVLFGVIEGIFYWTDTLMLGYYRGVQEVGLYNAAVPIALLLVTVSDLFTTTLFPLVTKEYSRNRVDLIKNLSKQVSSWVFTLNLPVVLFVLIFPEAIIRLFFGNQYLQAAAPLQFLILGYFALSMFSISSKLILMTGRSKLVLLDISIALVLNIVLNYVLIPTLGMNGAAIATLISLLVLSILFVFQVKRTLSFTQLKASLFRVMLASLIPLALLLVFRSALVDKSLILIVAISITFFLAYLLLVILGKGLNEHDLYLLGLIKNKIFPSGAHHKGFKQARNPKS